MTKALPYLARSSMILSVLALLGLVGCAMDDEEQVRALLGRWISLGSTEYFKSTYECTAAVIDVRSDQIKSAVRVVSSANEGLVQLRRGQAVAFDVPGLSPTLVSEQIMSTDLPEGLGILSSGLSAKNCMTDAITADYLAALTAQDGVLFFDPDGNAMAALNRTTRTIFFARGGT